MPVPGNSPAVLKWNLHFLRLFPGFSTAKARQALYPQSTFFLFNRWNKVKASVQRLLPLHSNKPQIVIDFFFKVSFKLFWYDLSFLTFS